MVATLLFCAGTLAATAGEDIDVSEAPLLACLALSTEAPALCIGLGAAACIDNEDGGAATDTITLCQAQETEFWEARLNAALDALAERSSAWDADLGDQSTGAEAALGAMQLAWEPYTLTRCALLDVTRERRRSDSSMAETSNSASIRSASSVCPCR